MLSPTRAPKAGEKFRDWTFVEKLDDGGNADVWEVRHENGTVGALKALRNLNQESYGRFRNEINVLSKIAGLPGIIPMIDQDFPEGEKPRPWYVMPLATRCHRFLKRKGPRQIVEEFIKLGETLCTLHSRKIAHRDIKPENVLALDGRLCLSDFGLVKYPDLSPMTPERRDVGAKFTMAPEMRREASEADGLPADVFSFAKTLWICLTGEKLGFDGPYIATSSVGLRNFLGDEYTTTLDEVMTACTQHDPAARPTIERVIEKLRDWRTVVEDFHLRNAREWDEFAKRFFPIQAPAEATWTELDGIIEVLDHIGKITSLNHMFMPSGGGFTLLGAKRAAEPGFIDLNVDLTILLKPAKLTYVSFGLDPKWDYLRLETDPVVPTGYYPVEQDDFHEYLSELRPGQYAHPDVVEYRHDYERNVPEGARSVTRQLRGSFVLFSTSSPYNQTSATYDARHQTMGEAGFKDYMRRSAQKSAKKKKRKALDFG